MTIKTLPDEEMSALDLLSILIKRKALIFSILIVSILIGIAYTELKQPVFEASVTLRIGQVYIDDPLQLESPNALVARLSSAGGGAIMASAVRGTDNLISVTALGGSREEALSALNSSVQLATDSHAEIYRQSTEPIQDRIKQIESQRQTLVKELTSINVAIQQLRQKEPTQASVLLMQRTLAMQAIPQLDIEHLERLQQLRPPQTRRTETLGSIIASDHPAKPKRFFAIAMSSLIGILVGILIAFLAEFVVRAKATRLSS